jgi:hypothetical protein
MVEACGYDIGPQKMEAWFLTMADNHQESSIPKVRFYIRAS